MPAKYTHKPTEIQAIQLTPDSFDECVKFVGEAVGDGTSQAECTIVVAANGAQEECTFHEGDYVINGVLGIFYPCSAAVFEESYEVTE